MHHLMCIMVNGLRHRPQKDEAGVASTRSLRGAFSVIYWQPRNATVASWIQSGNVAQLTLRIALSRVEIAVHQGHRGDEKACEHSRYANLRKRKRAKVRDSRNAMGGTR